MARILQELDHEWSHLASSPAARRTLTRWAHQHPALAGHSDLNGLLEARRDPHLTDSVLRALASLARDGDDLAARTLLQAMVPGIVRLAKSIDPDGDSAYDDLVSMAWERIRTYPVSRPGSVPANILLDVRKHYRRHHTPTATASLELVDDIADGDRSTEDAVANRLLLTELVEAERSGVLSQSVLATILRTRVGGERLADLAAEQNISTQVLCHRRWRAEVRLRNLPLLPAA